MAYIGTSPTNGVRRKHTYTATASQTTFSGAGAEGAVLSYKDSNYVDVYVNGVKLGDADYTATSGTSIVLGVGAAVNDIVEIITYDVFSVADTVSKADGGQFDGNVSFADNTKAIFGAGSDLQIYHDGSNSKIQETGTGNLFIDTSDALTLRQYSTNSVTAKFVGGGASELYHNNSKKLETTSTGIDVTGNITFGDSHTIGDDADDNLEIATSLGENLILKSSGNVVTYLDTNEDQSTAAYQIYGDVTSPRALLRVEETGDISFYEDTGTTPKLFWDASTERLGLGTISPSAALNIVSATNTEPLTIKATTNVYNYITHENAAGTDVAYTGLGGGAAVTTGSFTDYAIRATANLLFGAGSNTERMRLDSSGNLLVGATNPDIGGSVTGIKLAQNGSILASTDETDNIGNAPYYGDRRGTNNTGDILSLGLGGYIKASIGVIGTNNSTNDGGITFNTISANVTKTERMRIDSNGKVQISSDGVADGFLHIKQNYQTDIGMSLNDTSGSGGTAMRFKVNGSTKGEISFNTTSTTYATSSDHRLKENVTADWDATTRLKQLNPVRFNFIADADDTTVDGFLAHEVQSVVPEAITGTHNEVDDDGNPVYQGIDQSKLVPLLVKTIQELEARIVALENA